MRSFRSELSKGYGEEEEVFVAYLFQGGHSSARDDLQNGGDSQHSQYLTIHADLLFRKPRKLQDARHTSVSTARSTAGRLPRLGRS